MLGEHQGDMFDHIVYTWQITSSLHQIGDP